MRQRSESAVYIAVRLTVVVIIAISLPCLLSSFAQAESGIEFPGTVLSVDHAAGKFAVKKDSSGTRFTFAANDKTQFEGPGLKSLKDMKKDDHVTVIYQVLGSQYIALKIMAQKR
ncbi:MAG: hypothetical protein ACT4OO_05350 [Nitrospiraceae bacterium]